MKSVYLLPNLFTTGNIVFGLLSIIHSIQGNFEKAAWFIILAIICDGLDGKIAVLTRTTSRFGINYDSLADLVSFGVAPAILLSEMVFDIKSKLSVALVVIYTVCVALRLARFNVQAFKEEKGEFVGLPSPTGGGTIAAIVLCVYELGIDVSVYYTQIGLQLCMLGLAILMVSKIPYFNLKRIHIERRKPFNYLVIFILIVGIVIINLPIALLASCFVYISYGLIRWLRHTSKPVSEESPVVESYANREQ
jgi:CDP-diacylglycerol--serine O-phosphatidyltransferase